VKAKGERVTPRSAGQSSPHHFLTSSPHHQQFVENRCGDYDFVMPAGVPKEAVSHMEAVLQRVYNSAAWKEHAARNFYENIWLGSADYAKHLAERSIQVRDFQQAIGLLAKP